MICLEQALLHARGWNGSMLDLAAEATRLCEFHALSTGIFLPKTTKTLVMSYRALKILSPPHGKRFGWLHLVELLAIRHLVLKGWRREDTGPYLARFSTEYIAENLASVHEQALEPQHPLQQDSDAVLERASIAIRLLAAGISEQFRMARGGMPTAHDDTLSPMLTQAIMLLSSLYISSNKEDRGGSVHEVLERCRWPIDEQRWFLPMLSSPLFAYKGITLLDPDRRIPTLDCAEMARQTQGELDLREQMAFEALRGISQQFIGKQDAAYSSLRMWVTEHPITTGQALRSFGRDHGLMLAVPFLASCYEPVQPYHQVNEKLYPCEKCGTPMRRSRSSSEHLNCRTPQCAAFDKPLEALPLHPNADMLIAKPHILVYWIGPGLDELTLYQAALKNGLEPKMYPSRDACDLSFSNDEVGVDVKSYASPYVLVDRLNKGHGLAPYGRRIVAINEQVIARSFGYLEVLRRRYSGSVTLEFMSVLEVTALMEQPF